MNSTATETTVGSQVAVGASTILNGTYTLVGPRGRRTIDVKTVVNKHGSDFEVKFEGRRTVKLLTGSDNETDYTMIGWLDGDTFVPTFKQRNTANEIIGRAFTQIVTSGIDGYEFMVASRCRRCNRKLTVPSSIDAGLGPDCAGKA